VNQQLLLGKTKV